MSQSVAECNCFKINQGQYPQLGKVRHVEKKYYASKSVFKSITDLKRYYSSKSVYSSKGISRVKCTCRLSVYICFIETVVIGNRKIGSLLPPPCSQFGFKSLKVMVTIP